MFSCLSRECMSLPQSAAFRMSAVLIPPLVAVNIAALQVECQTWLLEHNPFWTVSAVTDVASTRSAYLDGLKLELSHQKGRTPSLETPQFNSLLWKGHTKNWPEWIAGSFHIWKKCSGSHINLAVGFIWSLFFIYYCYFLPPLPELRSCVLTVQLALFFFYSSYYFFFLFISSPNCLTILA